MGYDCRLIHSVRTLFFQFKVPRKLTNRHAKYWDEFRREYYSFDIWPDGITHQHNELIDLAKRDRKHKVFYCSPAFITKQEYSDYYVNKQIAKRSIYIPCENLEYISGMDKHDISYT